MDTWYFSSSSGIDDNRMLEYINKRTQQKVILKRGFFEVLISSIAPLLLLGCLALAVIKFRWILMKPMSWFIISCVVFLICCGGVVHNVLHKVPFAGVSKSASGALEYEYISTGVIFDRVETK